MLRNGHFFDPAARLRRSGGGMPQPEPPAHRLGSRSPRGAFFSRRCPHGGRDARRTGQRDASATLVTAGAAGEAPLAFRSEVTFIVTPFRSKPDWETST